jgi:hypothetical protein
MPPALLIYEWIFFILVYCYMLSNIEIFLKISDGVLTQEKRFVSQTIVLCMNPSWMTWGPEKGTVCLGLSLLSPESPSVASQKSLLPNSSLQSMQDFDKIYM